MTDRKRLVITDEDMGLASRPEAASPAPVSPPHAAPALPPVAPAGPRLQVGSPAAAFAPPAQPAAAAAPAPPLTSPPAAPSFPPTPFVPSAEFAPPPPPAGYAPPQGFPPPPVPAAPAFAAPPGGTPTSAVGALPLANLGQRFLALVIDRLIVVGVVIACFAVVLIGGMTGSFAVTLMFLLLGLGGTVFALVHLLLKPLTRPGDRHGQTYGMQAMGLRVVHEDGSPFTLGAAFFYWVVPELLFSITFLGSLANAIWPLFDERRQSLRDKIAKTVAVSA